MCIISIKKITFLLCWCFWRKQRWQKNQSSSSCHIRFACRLFLLVNWQHNPCVVYRLEWWYTILRVSIPSHLPFFVFLIVFNFISYNIYRQIMLKHNTIDFAHEPNERRAPRICMSHISCSTARTRAIFKFPHGNIAIFIVMPNFRFSFSAM